MPRRPCLACGTPTAGTYCPAHRTDHGYSSSHWQRVRLEVLLRDGYRCRLKHDGCTTIATTVHLDPDRLGLHRAAFATDCLAACEHCHGVEDGERATNERR